MHGKKGDEDICHWEKKRQDRGPCFSSGWACFQQQGPALSKILRQAEGAPPPPLLTVTWPSRRKGSSL